jgi:AbrB family looped-hinge helix DNA binding protein
MVTARITSKGQITVPKAVRQHLGVEPGDSLEFEFTGERVAVRPVKRRRIAEFYGLFPVSAAADFAVERAQAWRAMTERQVSAAATAEPPRDA